MTETAQALIDDALQEIVVLGAESAAEGSEAQSAIRYLNRMMARWTARGYTLGYTDVDSLSDSVTVPDYALDAIVSNLALSLASQYGVMPSQDLVARANSSIKTVRLNTISAGTTARPNTLPLGAGNWEAGDDEMYYDGS